MSTVDSIPTIKELPPELVKQIAAGEVVERPASAIKELVDNSVDAGATKITIELLTEDGRSFRITDNGIGIAQEQIPLAFTLHATSKVSNLEDLNSISTKGFRGEALASIASVSDIKCITKHIDSEYAIEASFDKNNNLQYKPTAFSQGTCFEVRDLFRKVPARLNFLKQPATELQAIYDTVQNMAIMHPDISFTLKNIKKNRLLLQTSGSGSWQATVSELYEKDIKFQYIEAQDEENNITVQGLIAPLSFAKSNPRSIITAVNHRAIICPVIRKAIRDVYQGVLPRNKYPQVIINVLMPFEMVDVNVHPTKSEVRYKEGDKIYKLVKKSIEKYLITSVQNPVISSSEMDSPQEQEQKILQETDPRILGQDNRTEQNNISSEKIQELFSQSVAEIKQASKQNTDKTVTEEEIKNSEEKFKEKVQELLNKKKDYPEIPQEINTSKIGLIINSLQIIQDKNSNSKIQIGDYSLNYYNHNKLTPQQKVIEQLLNKHLYKFLEELNTIELEEISEQQELISIEKEQDIIKRKKPNTKLLEKIWSRDNYRCVYTGKYLLHPELIKQIKEKYPDLKKKRLNKESKLIEEHVTDEYKATHDHFIPFSQVSSLDEQEDNLYACSSEANIQKSDSIDYNTWKITQYPVWESPLEITHNSQKLIIQSPLPGGEFSLE